LRGRFKSFAFVTAPFILFFGKIYIKRILMGYYNEA
jgi:hypothetical protein